MLPDHEPEVADCSLQWTLCQDVPASSFFHLNETGVNVVAAAGQADPAVVICGTRVSLMAECGTADSQGVTSRYRFRSRFSLLRESLLL